MVLILSGRSVKAVQGTAVAQLRLRVPLYVGIVVGRDMTRCVPLVGPC